jgi:hypothetical protein
VLQRELFEELSGESAELLQNTSGTGQSDQRSAGRAAFRIDPDYARRGGDSCDFALSEHRCPSRVLAT